MRSLLAGALSLSLASAALLAGCGSDDKPPPPPPPPTRLNALVIDGSTGAPISGAHFQLLEPGLSFDTDANGSVLQELDPGVYTYRAQAAGYVSSPKPGQRYGYVSILKELTVELRIVLEPKPNAVSGGTLSGALTQGGVPVKGALVIASATGFSGAITDAAGHYTMSGVAPDFYSVSALVPGFKSSVQTNIEMKAGMEKTAVDLTLSADPGASVGGTLVGGTGTSSVSLAHAGSGELVPGLSTTASMDNGMFSIAQVPPASYRVLAGRELDGFTYEAQWILDNGNPEVTVTDTSSKSVELRFASGIRGIMPVKSSSVSDLPTVHWPTVPMADFYVVEIQNVAGQVVVGGFDIRGSAREPVLAPMTSYTVHAMPLVHGALYTWRVFAAKDVTTGQLFQLLSASEELEGSFRVQR